MSYGVAARVEAQSIDPTDLSWVNEIIRYIKAQTHIPSLEPLHNNLFAESLAIPIKGSITSYSNVTTALMQIYSQASCKEISRWGVSREISHYVNRSMLERCIVEKLAHGSTVVIISLKGMGKTQLASHVLHTRPEKIKIWFNAESRQRLYEQYETFLLDCDVLSSEKRQEIALHPQKADIVIAAVKRYLAEREDWLVVYDNATTYSDIVDILPPSKDSGKIIITSQSKEWPRGSVIEVDVMTEAEAVKLLTEIAGEHNPADIAELVKELGYFPLAITQAAAYMVDQRMPPKAYRELYKIRATELLKEESSSVDHLHENVWITFVLVLEKIYEQNPLAVALLYYTGWLAESDIPLTLLGCIHYQSNDWLSPQLPTVKQALAVLEKYSLLKASGTGDKVVYSIHRVLQKFLQVSVSPEMEKRLVIPIMQGLVRDYTLANEVEHLNMLHIKQLMPHFGQLDQILRRAELQASLKSKPSNYMSYAAFLANYASCANVLGEIIKNIELLEEVLEIEKIHYGEGHIKVARVKVNLANAYGDLGNTIKQKALLEQALAIKIEHYGEGHVEVARTKENLANVYGALGEDQKQKELLEQALEIQRAQYGENHIEVTRSLSNLALAYGALGDAKKKKELLEQALAILIAHYGKSHADVAITQANLANAYGDLGEVEKKKEFLEQALAILMAHYGESHAVVALTKANLANAYGVLGDAKKQKELLEQALAIEIAHYGEGHVEVSRTKTNLANAYGDLGDAKKKKELLEQALVIFLAQFGEGHVEVARTKANLANAYGDLGDAKKKKELLEQALVIFLAQFGEGHVEVAMTQFNLAVAEANLKHFTEALALLEKCERIFSTQPGGSQYLAKCVSIKEEIRSMARDVGALSSRSGRPSSSGNSPTLNDILIQFKGSSDTLPTAETALRRAAVMGKVKELEFLANHADINAQDDNPSKKMTALHWAVIKGQKESVELLLRLGVNKEIKDAANKTAEDYAKASSNSEIKSLLTSIDNNEAYLFSQEKIKSALIIGGAGCAVGIATKLLLDSGVKAGNSAGHLNPFMKSIDIFSRISEKTGIKENNLAAIAIVVATTITVGAYYYLAENNKPVAVNIQSSEKDHQTGTDYHSVSGGIMGLLQGSNLANTAASNVGPGHTN